MYQTIKTINGSYLEQCRDKNKPWVPLQYSTLNEKYSVHMDVAIQEGSYPVESYITCGRGGHRGTVDVENRYVVDVATHGPTDAAMFDAIPFIMRPVDQDLTVDVRNGYGMRTLITKNGVDYFAYMLKKVDFGAGNPTISVNVILDGITSTTPYIPTPAQLEPVPTVLSNVEANVSTGTSIAVDALTEINIDSNTVSELLNSCLVLYGDARYASVSEIGIVTAIPTSVNGTLGGVNVTYVEAIAAQISNFIPANVTLPLAVNGFNLGYTMGTEVLYNP